MSVVGLLYRPLLVIPVFYILSLSAYSGVRYQRMDLMPDGLDLECSSGGVSVRAAGDSTLLASMDFQWH